MTVHNRGRTDDASNLVHHSDMSVQYLSVRYSEHLEKKDIVASVGSRGDSYDNAPLGSFNGRYQREIIYRHGPWQSLTDVECATLEYVDWLDHRRLYGQITDGPGNANPVEHENDYYDENPAATEPVPALIAESP